MTKFHWLYVQNWFRGEALLYYDSEVESLDNNYADVIANTKSLFISISKLLCVKAELSGFSFQNMIENLMVTE